MKELWTRPSSLMCVRCRRRYGMPCFLQCTCFASPHPEHVAPEVRVPYDPSQLDVRNADDFQL